MITEKRKEYLKNYRRANRSKLSAHWNNWKKRSGRRYPVMVNGKRYEYSGNKELNYELSGMSGVGRKFELIAITILSGAKDTNNKNGFTKNGWDIEWRGKKIDVKMTNNIYKNSGWNFISSNKVADYLMLFCCFSNITQKVYLIPTKHISTTSIYVGKKSKWDEYLLTTPSL